MDSIIERFHEIENIRLSVMENGLTPLSLADSVEILEKPIDDKKEVALMNPWLIREELNMRKSKVWKYQLLIKRDKNNFPIYWHARVSLTPIPLVLEEIFVSQGFPLDSVMTLHLGRLAFRICQYRGLVGNKLKLNSNRVDDILIGIGKLGLFSSLKPWKYSLMEAYQLKYSRTLLEFLNFIENCDLSVKYFAQSYWQLLKPAMKHLDRVSLADIMDMVIPTLFTRTFDQLQQSSLKTQIGLHGKMQKINGGQNFTSYSCTTVQKDLIERTERWSKQEITKIINQLS